MHTLETLHCGTYDMMMATRKILKRVSCVERSTWRLSWLARLSTLSSAQLAQTNRGEFDQMQPAGVFQHTLTATYRSQWQLRQWHALKLIVCAHEFKPPWKPEVSVKRALTEGNFNQLHLLTQGEQKSSYAFDAGASPMRFFIEEVPRGSALRIQSNPPDNILVRWVRVPTGGNFASTTIQQLDASVGQEAVFQPPDECKPKLYGLSHLLASGGYTN